jgi:rubrerythrin
MSMTDIEKLRALLPHWLEHNMSHADDYRAWSERARAAGADHVAEHLAAAVEKLAEVHRDLQGALEHLGGPDTAASHDHPHVQQRHDP